MDINDTQATALAYLAVEPMNPGELFRRTRETVDFWNVTRSQLYRELPKLAETGMVKAGEPGQRGATMYRITAAGKKALAGWLASEAQVIVRDGRKARDHFRSMVGTEMMVPVRKKRAKPSTEEDAPAPKKRTQKRKKAAPAAE